MILFTLRCARGHHFDVGFLTATGSRRSETRARSPVPNAAKPKSEKAVMAPRLGNPLRRSRRLAVALGVTEDLGGGA